MSNWTAKNTKGQKERWYVFAGRAYPRVVQGSNKTTRITSDLNNRDAFYNDPAVVLSDSDLDRFNGAEGKPLCVEHKLSDQVGYVHHSWIGDGDKRSLKIIGRISLETQRGREVVRDIKAGKLNGLSVGYGTEMASTLDNRHTELLDKNFREISLVFEPFFSGCDLAQMGVTATKNPNHNNFDEKSILLLRVDASKEFLMDSSQTAGLAHTQKNTLFSSSFSPIVAPLGPPLVPAAELLAEADKLKSQLTEETKAKELGAQEMAKLKAELDELRALKEQVVAKQKAEDDAYAASQEPKFEAYVAEVGASGKVALNEVMKKELRNTFCNPRYKDGAAHLWADHTERVELKASKKAADERIKALEDEKQKLESAVKKTSQVLNHSRSEFAASLNPKEAAKEDESRRKTNISNTDVSNSCEFDINASANGLRRIMACEPTLEETEFMQAYGFGSAGVTASSGYSSYGSRQRITSMPIAASHTLIRDEDGNLNNPGGMRFGTEGQQMLFSWMTTTPHLHGDLSDVLRMKEDKNRVEKRDPKHLMMV